MPLSTLNASTEYNPILLKSICTKKNVSLLSELRDREMILNREAVTIEKKPAFIFDDANRDWAYKNRYKMSHLKAQNSLGLYIGCVEDAYLVGGSSVVTKDQLMIAESLNPIVRHSVINKTPEVVWRESFVRTSDKQHYVLKKEYNVRETIHDPVFLLTNSSTDGWYFWLMDLFPLLFYWLKYGAEKNIKFIISRRVMAQYEMNFDILEMLEILNISKDNLYLYDEKESVHLDRIYIANGMSTLHSHIEPELKDFYNAFIEKCFKKWGKPQQIHKNIYFSRHARCRHRPLVNEDRLIKYLKSRDFEILETSELSVKEKIDAMYGADVVISAVGMGVSNLLFSGEGGQFIGIWPHYYGDFYIIDLCSLYNREYGFLFAEGFQNSFRHSDGNHRYNQPFFVNIDRLDNIMSKIGL